jgi:hypothetical protein
MELTFEEKLKDLKDKVEAIAKKHTTFDAYIKEVMLLKERKVCSVIMYNVLVQNVASRFDLD